MTNDANNEVQCECVMNGRGSWAATQRLLSEKSLCSTSIPAETSKKKNPEPTFTVQTSDLIAFGVLSYNGFHANSGLLEQCKAKSGGRS